MARGFDSKSVADQQASAQESDKPHDEQADADPAVVLKRRRLELARADVLHQLQVARAEAHKEMLRRALEALEKDLARLA